MASLLSKFRIDYSALKVISGISKPAQAHTVSFFESLISDFLQENNPGDGSSIDDGTDFLLLLCYVNT